MDNQQLVIINVPFDMEWKEVESHRGEAVELLKERIQLLNGMPWLEYLIDHACKVETKFHYNPAAMLYRADYQFFLTLSDATMYRLKYS